MFPHFEKRSEIVIHKGSMKSDRQRSANFKLAVVEPRLHTRTLDNGADLIIIIIKLCLRELQTLRAAIILALKVKGQRSRSYATETGSLLG